MQPPTNEGRELDLRRPTDRFPPAELKRSELRPDSIADQPQEFIRGVRVDEIELVDVDVSIPEAVSQQSRNAHDVLCALLYFNSPKANLVVFRGSKDFTPTRGVPSASPAS